MPSGESGVLRTPPGVGRSGDTGRRLDVKPKGGLLPRETQCCAAFGHGVALAELASLQKFGERNLVVEVAIFGFSELTRERQPVLIHRAIAGVCFGPSQTRAIQAGVLPVEKVHLAHIVRIDMEGPPPLAFLIRTLLTSLVSSKPGTPVMR